MTGDEFLDLMRQARRPTHVIGNSSNGVIIALDMEGRLFTVFNGRILNRVNPVAILNYSNRATFFNPGGDALWPAPEGSCFGYEYSTGEWRVPPSITSACWKVVDQSEKNAVIRAEIDLVNNSQLGIPCEFERQINFDYDGNQIVLRVIEKIRYLGARTLEKNEFSLAPWSLCQFDSGTDSKLIIPTFSESDVWDIYSCSDSKRILKDNTFIYDTDTDFRFQVGIGKNVPWIEYISGNSLRVKRFIKELPQGQHHIDIADSSPLQYPAKTGVKLSIYCDPSGFTEIEACGGSTDRLHKGNELSVEIITIFSTSITK